ncbi:MAG: hypothetical protein ACO22K_11060 [Woeseiaceae bacterium]
MRKTITIALIAVPMSLPCATRAADVQSILEIASERQVERWEGVSSYALTQSVAGNRFTTYYQRVEVEDDAGQVHTMFLPVSAGELSASAGETPRLTPEALEAYAQGLEVGGDALSSEIEGGLEQAGLPGGLLAATGGDPWVSADPGAMMGGGLATFARAAAAESGSGDDHATDAGQAADQIASFAAAAKLVGTETIDGRDAFHLEASELNQVQQLEGQEFELQRVSLWIDTEHYVPLQTKMVGVMTSGGESRPVSIEQISSDYRDVAGSSMYESYRQLVRISGMLDVAQQKEMQKAQEQMLEFEQQLASMPASQRKMMESMMGPQLEMMRNMAAGGGFQMETVIEEITVNPDL